MHNGTTITELEELVSSKLAEAFNEHAVSCQICTSDGLDMCGPGKIMWLAWRDQFIAEHVSQRVCEIMLLECGTA